MLSVKPQFLKRFTFVLVMTLVASPVFSSAATLTGNSIQDFDFSSCGMSGCLSIKSKTAVESIVANGMHLSEVAMTHYPNAGSEKNKKTFHAKSAYYDSILGRVYIYDISHQTAQEAFYDVKTGRLMLVTSVK